MTSYTYDEAIVSDLHKDAYGFRPREGFWNHWNLSTHDEKQEMWDGLLRLVALAIEAHRVALHRRQGSDRNQVLRPQGAVILKILVKELHLLDLLLPTDVSQI